MVFIQFRQLICTFCITFAGLSSMSRDTNFNSQMPSNVNPSFPNPFWSSAPQLGVCKLSFINHYWIETLLQLLAPGCCVRRLPLWSLTFHFCSFYCNLLLGSFDCISQKIGKMSRIGDNWWRLQVLLRGFFKNRVWRILSLQNALKKVAPCFEVRIAIARDFVQLGGAAFRIQNGHVWQLRS